MLKKPRFIVTFAGIKNYEKLLMSFDIVPVNPDAGVYGFPNGFWPALCVETPVSRILGCEYTAADRYKIRYEHDGYIGEMIDEKTALEMYKVLVDFVKTDEFKNHRYFSTRQNQMEYMLEFLPLCGGFRAAF